MARTKSEMKFDTFANFPTTGALNKLYIATDTDAIFRWDWASYVSVIDWSGWSLGILKTTTSVDPIIDGAVTTAIIDDNGWVIITTTTTWNNQTLASPTDTTAWKEFTVVSDDTSTDNIEINWLLLEPWRSLTFLWDWSAFVSTTRLDTLDINNLSTWNIQWWVLSINVDTTKFDVSDWNWVIVDNVTDPEKPTLTRVSWTWLTAQTVTNIATSLRSFIAIDINGVIVQQTVPFTTKQARSLIILGDLWHPDNTNIIATSSTWITPVYNTALTTSDMAKALWVINISGNRITPNGANLSINRSAWIMFSLWVNTNNDLEDQNTIVTLSDTLASFFEIFRDGIGGFTVTTPTTTVVPWSYDDWDWTLWSVWNNQWSIKRTFYSASEGITLVAYWQNLYSSLASAEQSISSDSFTLPDEALLWFVLLWSTAVKWNTTDLSDTAENLFFNASKLWEFSWWPTWGSTDLQASYNNSLNPEILTDATRWAMTIRRGSALDTDNVYEWENGAWTMTSSIDGNWVIDGTGITKGWVNVPSISETATLTNKTLTSPVVNVTSDAEWDIYYRNASGLFTRLPIGTATQTLQVNAWATALEYITPAWGWGWAMITFQRPNWGTTTNYFNTWTNSTGVGSLPISVQAGTLQNLVITVSVNTMTGWTGLTLAIMKNEVATWLTISIANWVTGIITNTWSTVSVVLWDRIVLRRVWTATWWTFTCADVAVQLV